MNKYSSKLVILWIAICVLGRIIPHPANVTPLTNISIFAGAKLKRGTALIVMLLALAISDIILAYLQGHSIFGSWSLFTYSGFAAITLLGAKLKPANSLKSRLGLLSFVLSSSLGFWIWTNFGTWLCSGVYTKTATGLISCYSMALPFLQNSLLGDAAWFVIVFLAFDLIEAIKTARVAERQTRWI